MRSLITGAGGFVGRALAARLSGEVVLTDLHPSGDPRLIAGDLTDPAHLDTLFARPFDRVFHLASLPGGAAEANPERGAAVNLHASLALADRLARQARGGGPVARLVFASTIAVYGAFGDAPVTEDQPPRPNTCYGAHKLMVEIALADLARRGWVESVSLRLPGVVARPRGAAGFGSAFLSEMFHAARAGQDWVCPVSPQATSWFVSLPGCIDNLLTAARIDPARLPPGRVVQMPALAASIGAVLEGLGQALGPQALRGITHAPDPRLEALFGRQPPLHTPNARALGLRAEGSVAELVHAVLGAMAADDGLAALPRGP